MSIVRLNTRTIDEDLLKRLQMKTDDELEKQRPHLEGLYNYSILTNPKYQKLFMYVSGVTPHRNKQIVSEFKDVKLKQNSCDVVRIITDLAYFDKKQIS